MPYLQENLGLEEFLNVGLTEFLKIKTAILCNCTKNNRS